MTDLDAVRCEARDALAQPGSLTAADSAVPAQPGLYAIYGEAVTWDMLGLGEPPDGRPLYVGKAEESLVTRDLKTHFGDGRTGQSTVRRSFAALLHDTLGLRGMPRNPVRPAYFSNYGLSADHDAALSSWMRDHLQLAVWPKPNDSAFTLGQVEAALLVKLLPPLNLQGVVTPWTAQVEAARAVMVEEARAWAADRTPAELGIEPGNYSYLTAASLYASAALALARMTFRTSLSRRSSRSSAPLVSPPRSPLSFLLIASIRTNSSE